MHAWQRIGTYINLEPLRVCLEDGPRACKNILLQIYIITKIYYYKNILLQKYSKKKYIFIITKIYYYKKYIIYNFWFRMSEGIPTLVHSEQW